VDLETGTLTVRRARQRPGWKHGCTDPCGRKSGGHCPDRQPLRTETADTRSRAGRRSIGLPNELVLLFQTHAKKQAIERVLAGHLWHEAGGCSRHRPATRSTRVRTTEWKRLLKLVGLRDGRLHDARHTAATVLLILGTAERAIMSLTGWSDSGMAKRYQHMTAKGDDIARRVGGLRVSEVSSGTPRMTEMTARQGCSPRCREGQLRPKLRPHGKTPGSSLRATGRFCWCWRWRRDLNPRRALTLTRFRGVLLRPLGHATAEKNTGHGPGRAAGYGNPPQRCSDHAVLKTSRLAGSAA
jgi:hypothetical protein